MTKATPFAWLLALGIIAGPVVWAEAPEAAEETKKDEAKTDEAKEPDQMPVYGHTMVVTASRDEERLQDAPISITVIGPDKLDTTPADNYADVLRGVPGLNVVQFGARDVNFTSRGATNSLATGTLALVDGRSVYQDFFGFVAWDFLPVSFDEVKQIEVLRGPGSAVWGANALSGVVNIRTRSPRESAGGEAMFGIGEVGTYQGFFRWANAMDEWSYKVSGSYFEQEPWDRPTSTPSGQPLPPYQNEGTEQPKFDLRFDYDPDPETHWSFSGGGGYTTGLIHSGIGPFSVDSGTGTTYGKVNYTRGGWDVSGYLNYLDGDGTNLLNGILFNFQTTTFAGDGTWRRAWGDKQVFLLGATARFNSFDLSIAPRDDQRNEAGFFIQDDIHLSEHFQINLGVRADWFDTIDWTFSPRTAVIFKPHEDHSIRFAYNRAYRAPSLVNNFLETAVPNLIVLPPPISRPFVFTTAAVGNENLDEEKVDAFELGYTATLADRVTLTAAVYRNETKDNIDFFPSAFYGPGDPPAGWPLPPAFVPPFTLPKEFTYRNIAKVIDKGFELGVDVEVARGWNLSGSYSYQDESEVEDADALFQTNIAPQDLWALNLNFRRGIWYGSAGVTFTDEAFWTDVLDQRFWGPTDSYTLLNATFGVNLLDDRLSFAFKGTNLSDEDAQQHVFGVIIKRKISGEVRVRFGG